MINCFIFLIRQILIKFLNNQASLNLLAAHQYGPSPESDFALVLSEKIPKTAEKNQPVDHNKQQSLKKNKNTHRFAEAEVIPVLLIISLTPKAGSQWTNWSINVLFQL